MKNNIPEYQKNFFFSANSEAYQDAFLAWIFFNFNTEGELGKFSRYMIEDMLNSSGATTNKQKIEFIKLSRPLKRQKHDSDLSLLIETNDGVHLMLIEDKAHSNLHRSKKKTKQGEPQEYYNTQLDKYFDLFSTNKKYSKFIKSLKCHFIFYKNEMIADDEMDIIQSSNEYIKNHEIMRQVMLDLEDDNIVFPSWVKYDIERICNLFADFLKKENKEHFDNYILDSYYKNIKMWCDIYLIIKTSNDFDIEYDSPDFDIFWNEQSWLWKTVFYKLKKTVWPEENNTENNNIIIQKTQSGHYWELGKHSEKVVMLITARTLSKKSKNIALSINVRNSKYGDCVPWSSDNENEYRNQRNQYMIKLRKDMQKQQEESNNTPSIKKELVLDNRLSQPEKNDANLAGTYYYALKNINKILSFSELVNATKDLYTNFIKLDI